MSEEFFEHIGELLKSSEFSDVTIVSDDQKIFKGHRNILSGFSPVLKKLFKIDTNNQSPLLYLNGINSSELNAIMEFIYCNTVPKTWTEQLQSAVISLEIKGIHIPVTQLDLPSLPEIEIEETHSLRRALFSDSESPVESQEKESTNADDLISKATYTEETDSDDSGMSIAKRSHVKVKLSDLVDFRVYSNSFIDSNPSIKESDKDDPCDQCDYNSTDKSNLSKHKKAVHEGFRYPCNFCEYTSICRTGLKNHMSSKHEGNMHQCHLCGKQFSTPRSLNCHMRGFHAGMRMKVKGEFCEYHTTKNKNANRSLLVHFQKMHKDIPIELFREKMKSNSRHRGPRKPTGQLLQD